MPALKKRFVTAEDLYSLQQLSDVRISPDGGQVVYRVQRVDRKTEKKYGNLWIVPAAGGEPRQFTYGNQSDSSPHWSPDGNTIAFLSSRAGNDNPQIHLIPFDGGEARKLTSIDGEISIAGWSPTAEPIRASADSACISPARCSISPIVFRTSGMRPIGSIPTTASAAPCADTPIRRFALRAIPSLS